MLVNTVSYIHREVLMGYSRGKDDPTFKSMVEHNDWPNFYLIMILVLKFHINTGLWVTQNQMTTGV